MLRNKMKQLDLELQRHRVVAKGEISAAKEAVRQVEQETLQGMRTLATGKTDIELAWRKLDTIQAKHKVWKKFLHLVFLLGLRMLLYVVVLFSSFLFTKCRLLKKIYY